MLPKTSELDLTFSDLTGTSVPTHSIFDYETTIVKSLSTCKYNYEYYARYLVHLCDFSAVYQWDLCEISISIYVFSTFSAMLPKIWVSIIRMISITLVTIFFTLSRLVSKGLKAKAHQKCFVEKLAGEIERVVRATCYSY